ncbi:MAG: hypothetical protein J6I66_05455 [Lachnospiraceae bacterium]|nr:hypothetical protein [Lachnospiraceae bacterium]MBP3754286.1 hypothetical protein [Lachnospiraceae bacterium]
MDDNFFVEEEIKNAAIKVRIIPWRLIANVVVLIIPPLAYYLAWPMLYTLAAVGITGPKTVFTFFMILTFFGGVVLLFWNAGKEIVVSGRGIVIRNFFLIQEAITLDQVYKCEVVTNLSVSSRYHTEHFSKAVIYYGDNSKVSVNDNMYRGWNELVAYMKLAGKTVYVDGRSRFSKYMDDKLGSR